MARSKKRTPKKQSLNKKASLQNKKRKRPRTSGPTDHLQYPGAPLKFLRDLQKAIQVIDDADLDQLRAIRSDGWFQTKWKPVAKALERCSKWYVKHDIERAKAWFASNVELTRIVFDENILFQDAENLGRAAHELELTLSNIAARPDGWDRKEHQQLFWRILENAKRRAAAARIWIDRTFGLIRSQLADDFGSPQSPKHWEDIFDLSWKTIRRRIERGDIRALQATSKLWMIHRKDIPKPPRSTFFDDEVD